MDHLVEQKQKRCRRLGRKVSRFFTAALLAVVSIVGACSPGETGLRPPPSHIFPERLAWSGVAANGLRIVVEPIAETIHAKPAIASEDDLLRSTFGIQDHQQLLRVSLRPSTSSGLPDKPGQVLVAADVYTQLTRMPEGLNAQARLMWHSVVTGGRTMVSAPGELEQWTYLLVATAASLPNRQDKMSWQSEALRVELQPQTWSEAERQQFLEAVTLEEDE